MARLAGLPILRGSRSPMVVVKTGTPMRYLSSVYDETVGVLKSAVQKAKLGQEEELAALKRLDDQARRLERTAGGPTVSALLAEERHNSPNYGGRSVFGWEK